MLQLNLELLLDNDQLSPRQERSLRRLVHYQFKVKDEQVCIFYTIKNSSYQERYTIYEDDKNNIYKHLMYGLLTIKLKKNIPEETIIKILNITDLDSLNYLRQNPIETKAQVLYSLVEEIYG